MPDSNSDADFQAVVTVGGAYLAISWLFTRLILSQTKPAGVSGFCVMEIALQVGFMAVMETQRKKRRADLGLTPKEHHKGDVALTILTWLKVFWAAWFFIYAETAILAIHAKTVHPIPLGC